MERRKGGKSKSRKVRVKVKSGLRCLAVGCRYERPTSKHCTYVLAVVLVGPWTFGELNLLHLVKKPVSHANAQMAAAWCSWQHDMVSVLAPFKEEAMKLLEGGRREICYC